MIPISLWLQLQMNETFECQPGFSSSVAETTTGKRTIQENTFESSGNNRQIRRQKVIRIICFLIVIFSAAGWKGTQELAEDLAKPFGENSKVQSDYSILDLIIPLTWTIAKETFQRSYSHLKGKQWLSSGAQLSIIIGRIIQTVGAPYLILSYRKSVPLCIHLLSSR